MRPQASTYWPYSKRPKAKRIFRPNGSSRLGRTISPLVFGIDDVIMCIIISPRGVRKDARLHWNGAHKKLVPRTSPPFDLRYPPLIIPRCVRYAFRLTAPWRLGSATNATSQKDIGQRLRGGTNDYRTPLGVQLLTVSCIYIYIYMRVLCLCLCFFV